MSAPRTLTSLAALALGSAALVGCASPSPASSGATASAPAAEPAAAPTSVTQPTAKQPAAKHSPTAHPSPAKGGSSQAGIAYCRASQLTVTATPVTRPENHLLITARNKSGKRCNLGIIGLVTFDGMNGKSGKNEKVRAEAPPAASEAVPPSWSPAGSAYEGVALDRQDAPPATAPRPRPWPSRPRAAV
ncbi:hypothetical protein GCM10020000_41910 [Streptomyces olivoverticillatus]